MRDNKITFINPQDFCKFIPHTPYPPLGVGYLSSVLKELGYEVNLIDGPMLTPTEYEKALYNHQTKITGITATIKQMPEAMRIARLIKNRNTDTITIMGGPGPSSSNPQDVLNSQMIDFMVYGEAEETLPQLLEVLRTGAKLASVPCIAYLENNKLIKTPVTHPPMDIDRFLLPDRDIFPQEKYLEQWKQYTGTTSLAIMSSRGCPFSCIFCDKTISGRHIRYRSANSIVNEMQIVIEKYPQLDDIFFYDDLFVCDHERVSAICNEIIKRGIKASWSAQARVDRVNDRVLKIMKEAGCNELYFGAESGSNRILRYLRKGFNRQQIIDAFNLCHINGIKPGVYIIIGVPGETQEDINETKSLIREIRPYLINFSYLTPFPNTLLFKNTSHLLRPNIDYAQWDEMTTTPYKSECFEVDPKDSHDQIYTVFNDLVAQGMEYNKLQFACEQ